MKFGVVIRSIGEATEDACKQSVLNAGIDESKVFIVKNKYPAYNAYLEMFRIARKQNLDWFLAIDADVVLLPNWFDLIKQGIGRTKDLKRYVLNFKINDYISDAKMYRGIHVYNGKYINQCVFFMKINAFLSKTKYFKKLFNHRYYTKPESSLDIYFSRCCVNRVLFENIIGLHAYEQKDEEVVRQAIVRYSRDKYYVDNYAITDKLFLFAWEMSKNFTLKEISVKETDPLVKEVLKKYYSENKEQKRDEVSLELFERKYLKKFSNNLDYENLEFVEIRKRNGRVFKRLMNKIIKKFLGLVLKTIPSKLLKIIVQKIFVAYISKLNKKEKIKFLLEFDNKLYSLQKRAALEYGNGIHPKHRHMKYHDFFINNINKGENILDIGCGRGILANAIAERSECSKVHGIEIDEQNFNFAKDNFKNKKLQFVLGDATEKEFEDSFDVVVLSNVLEHLKNRSDFLKKIKDNISPSRFLIRIPMYERDWRVPLKDELKIDYLLDPTHELEYTTEIFEKELFKAGLKIESAIYKWGELWAVVN